MLDVNSKFANMRPLLPVPVATAGEFRQSVAQALCCDPARVTIEQLRFSRNRRSARCWGIFGGKRFFAKTLIADPYPLNPPLTIPWRELQAAPFRTAEQQIEAEWNAGNRLRELTGPEMVPALMGKSAGAKTIVWEQVAGARVNHTVKAGRWVNAKSGGMATAVRKAGEWLRKLHNVSALGNRVIALDRMLESMRAQLQERADAISDHAKLALTLVENAAAKIGTAQLLVPAVLAHGDFMLANLLWDEHAGQVTVVDFENVAAGDLCQDLLTMIFDLRLQLLNPLIPKRAVALLEESFWQGYELISESLLLLLTALASAQILWFHLPRALARRREQGTMAGPATSVYRSLLEPSWIGH